MQCKFIQFFSKFMNIYFLLQFGGNVNDARLIVFHAIRFMKDRFRRDIFEIIANDYGYLNRI